MVSPQNGNRDAASLSGSGWPQNREGAVNTSCVPVSAPPEPEWLGRVVAALACLPRREATS